MANRSRPDSRPVWRNRASQLRRLTGGDIVLCPRCGDEMRPDPAHDTCPTCDYKAYRVRRHGAPDAA
jgi:rubrerythrin